MAAARAFPPDFWIVRPVQHLRQFELDLAQAVGAQFQSSLVQRGVVALLVETGVQVAKVGNFLAEAGEMFCNVRNLLDHTLYLPNRPGLFLRGAISSIRKPHFSAGLVYPWASSQ